MRIPRRNGVSRQSFRAILPIENLASHLSELQKTTGEALSIFGGVIFSTHARFYGRTVAVRERAEGESVRSNPRGSPRRRRRQAYGTSRPTWTMSNTHHRCAHGEHAQRLPQPATKLFCPFSSNCVGPTLELIYTSRNSGGRACAWSLSRRRRKGRSWTSTVGPCRRGSLSVYQSPIKSPCNTG